MNFIGEHLLPGKLGHLFIIIAFVASLLATIAYFTASRQVDVLKKQTWLKFARAVFLVQVAGVIAVFATIFYICSHHYFEYMYAYKHASLELESKYLLACIWEGQEGSFLLWTLWHSLLGVLLIFKAKEWEAPVMSIITLAQFFLLFMILGIYVGDVKLGNSLFSLTRNEIAAPIFSQPNYLNFIKDGIGLNVLLRNYWMVIHPPVLFLGFASTIIPFAYAYASIQMKRYSDWVKPVLPWTLFSATVLGVGIMMGGKWAYESLNFGGYWAWDPVENASLVPWLLLIAGLHTMVVYKATGHSLRASYFFAILVFLFILYSTFLTRTGILGDTSVHSFTEESVVLKTMMKILLAAFALPAFFLFFKHYKNIPAIHKEENTDSREFWMFIGSLVFFLTAMFIIAKTSVPVYNKIFGTKIAPPEKVEFSYNKVMVMIAIIIGMLTAFTQYLKYKATSNGYLLKKIGIPTLVAIAIATLIFIIYPFTYRKEGIGFLIAIYAAAFAGIFAFVANAMYIFIVLKGKLVKAGGSIAHAGFALMIVGMLISSGNKEVISNSRVNGITFNLGNKDPMTKEENNPKDNLTLIRQLGTRMADYEVTYLNDSTGHEKTRKFYQLKFEKKDPSTGKVSETFMLAPDVYMMKDNNMSSNPATKSYLTKDVFTYVSYALNDQNTSDTSSFKEVLLLPGESAPFGNGRIILDKVIPNPSNTKFNLPAADMTLMAELIVVAKDSTKYSATPLILVDKAGATSIDDTVYAQNLFVRFAGVTQDKKIRLGIKESSQMIDFVTVKAYVFPFINLVWLGLIIMALGLVISMIQRGNFSRAQAIAAFVFAIAGLFYMFLFANA